MTNDKNTKVNTNVDKISAGNDPKPSEAIPEDAAGEDNTTSPVSVAFESAVEFAGEISKGAGALIRGDYSYVLSPYAGYLIRIAGLLLAAFSLFDPFISAGNSGFYGWAQDLIINLIFAYFLFVVAEIVLVQRDIALALEKMNSTIEEPGEEEIG